MKIKIVVVSLLLSACQIDRDKTVDRSKFTFKTGDDTELFFKNMRQSYYELEENKEAGLNVFRLKKRIVDDSAAVLNLAIVVNYLQDEAYILLEPGKRLQQYDPLAVLWKDAVSNSSGEFRLDAMNRESMLEFGSLLFEGIEANYSLTLPDGAPFLASQAERQAFRITMSDYYRLTRIF